MLKNEEIRQKYPFFWKGLNDLEAEWMICSSIYKVCKREWKDYCDCGYWAPETYSLQRNQVGVYHFILAS